eukprot:s1701_g15.t1
MQGLYGGFPWNNLQSAIMQNSAHPDVPGLVLNENPWRKMMRRSQPANVLNPYLIPSHFVLATWLYSVADLRPRAVVGSWSGSDLGFGELSLLSLKLRGNHCAGVTYGRAKVTAKCEIAKAA